tara:strand:+ start:497 stop:1483 length:987 start_codon:yes stop_codon:yes gene_type:complete
MIIYQRIISLYSKITKLLGDYNLTMDLYNQRPHRYHCFVHNPWCPKPPINECQSGTYNTNTILKILLATSAGKDITSVFTLPNLADIEVWVIIKYRDLITNVLESVPKAYDNRQKYPCYQFIFPSNEEIFYEALCFDSIPKCVCETLCAAQIMNINRLYRNTFKCSVTPVVQNAITILKKYADDENKLFILKGVEETILDDININDQFITLDPNDLSLSSEVRNAITVINNLKIILPVKDKKELHVAALVTEADAILLLNGGFGRFVLCHNILAFGIFGTMYRALKNAGESYTSKALCVATISKKCDHCVQKKNSNTWDHQNNPKCYE